MAERSSREPVDLDVCCPVCHETWDTCQCDEADEMLDDEDFPGYIDGGDDDYCRLCGAYIADGGLTPASLTDPTLCVECAEDVEGLEVRD